MVPTAVSNCSPAFSSSHDRKAMIIVWHLNKMQLPLSLVIALGITFALNVRADEQGSGLRGVSEKETTKRNDQIISIPLIPYHNHPRVDEIESIQESRNMDRRRRHRRRLEKEDFNTIINSETGERGRQFESEVDEVFQGYGTHYVDVWVGTPPQRQTVIVDTGSWATSFPCSECTDCGKGHHADDYFDETKSSTFERVLDCDECEVGDCKKGYTGCVLSTAYSEGSSWKAYEAKDLVYTGGRHDKPSDVDTFYFNFGCQTKITGLFKTQLADGIMGMEMDDMDEKTTYWSQWYEAFKEQNYEKKFSLCFLRQDGASRSGTPAGAMTMGGTDVRLHRSKMLYVDQLKDTGWYTIRIRKIYLRLNGGERSFLEKGYDPDGVIVKQVDVSEEDINHKQTIVDSGTTDTYISEDIAKPFKKLWKELTGTNYNNKHHHLTEKQVENLPTVLFQLKADPELNDKSSPGLAGDLDPSFPMDVIIAMPPSHYLEYSKKSNRYASRLYFDREGQGTLGANFMMGHEILFDIENQVLGFSESDCDYSSLKDEEEGSSEEESSE